MNNKSYKLIILGKVQGVGYRAYAYKKALFFNLSGYVKNLENGTVICVVKGSDESITLFQKELFKGPYLSKVTEIIKENFLDYIEEGFYIKY